MAPDDTRRLVGPRASNAPFSVGTSANLERVLEVTVLYCRGAYVSTSLMPLEIFHSAGFMWNVCLGREPEPRFRITSASVDGDVVEALGPVRLTPDLPISDVEQTDLVFVPTAGMDVDDLLRSNECCLDWLSGMRRKGALVAGVCTGTALLAEAGLLDGRRATTHWAIASMFKDRWPAVDWRPELAVTEDGGVFCGGGLYSAIHLALYLVGRLCGRDVAVEVAKSLVLQMPRTYQTDFGFLPLSRDHSDAAIRRAEKWFCDHFPDDISVDRVAEETNMSPRTFLRRFKAATGETPRSYVQRLRVEAAKSMLEQDRMTVQEVSIAIGYEDVGFFRNLFKRYVGISPTVYRDRYG